jgi:hypothetical protein
MVANLVPKMRPQNCQNLENILVEIGIFLLLSSDFPHTKFDFLQRLSDFQEIQENFLQRLSDFFNGFPLSSMAFCFLQRLSDFPQWLSAFREIRENLFTAASIRKITI